MNDLTELIRNKIKNDATFQSLTGADASDSRIYYAWPWESKAISRTKPSYVTYYIGAGGGVPLNGIDVAQVSDVTYVFDIWSRSPNQARLVEERLVDLLHTQTFETSNYLAAYLKFDGRNEMAEEDIAGSTTHINMRFTLGPIVKKAGGFYSYTV